MERDAQPASELKLLASLSELKDREDEGLLRAGEAALTDCRSERCPQQGEPYLWLACPACGSTLVLHHAHNDSRPNGHSWLVQVEADGLTLLKHPENQGGGSGSISCGVDGCHFFIRSGQFSFEVD
ncbi:MAG: hypothetical protein HY329_15810 [Chloroflexi bacterium]|nr:hypothetical protein [Chloroflexota bacterium]